MVMLLKCRTSLGSIRIYGHESFARNVLKSRLSLTPRKITNYKTFKTESRKRTPVVRIQHHEPGQGKEVTDKDKADELLRRIENHSELLYYLSWLHHEFAKIGIRYYTSLEERPAMVWKYRLYFLIKYFKISNIFWEQCQYLNISVHKNTLGFHPSNIGILDPINFDKETYEQLQKGSYKNTNFRDIDDLFMQKKLFNSDHE